MHKESLVYVFLVCFFIVSTSACKLEGEWCLVSSQCCEHRCTWHFKCDKTHQIDAEILPIPVKTCIAFQAPCTSDSECCSLSCDTSVNGQAVCGLAANPFFPNPEPVREVQGQVIPVTENRGMPTLGLQQNNGNDPTWIRANKEHSEFHTINKSHSANIDMSSFENLLHQLQNITK